MDNYPECCGPCAWCGLNWETSHYFRPLDSHTCHECRKANRHLMNLGDMWEEFMVKWNQVQPYWAWRLHMFLYQLFKLGPIGMYKHRKAMRKFYDGLLFNR